MGSFWAHVEIMWCHCGHLGRTWSTWKEILEDLEQQEANRGQGNPKVRVGGVNRGHQGGTEGRRGATRIWVGGVWAANGGYRGKFLEFLERIQHALTMLKHGVADLKCLRHIPPTSFLDVNGAKLGSIFCQGGLQMVQDASENFNMV